MLCFPNAKINIGLNAIEKREDGFHNIETVFYPINLHDALEVVKSDGRELMEFTCSGLTMETVAKKNLCFQAYDMIQADFELPNLKMHLHKSVPIAAGLGGGSSDAAHCINLLDRYLDLGIAKESRLDYARQLGSDCSFFISNQSSFATGRGELLEVLSLNLKSYYIALVNPSIQVSTAEAYSKITTKQPLASLKEQITNLPVEQWKGQIVNDFEETVFKQYPKISQIKAKLYDLGAVYASMSGSGSTVYGFFRSEVNVAVEFPNYFTWMGEL